MNDLDLLAQRAAARNRLDRATDLLRWALDYGALIDMHGAWLDIQIMRDEAAAYRRAVAAYGRSARKGQSR